jgi:cytochrome b561
MSEQKTHPQKYHIGLRVLHWLIAALMLGAVVAGFVMEDLPLELKRQVVSLHISVGITVLALAIIRLVMRVTTSVPAIPDGLHSW